MPLACCAASATGMSTDVIDQPDVAAPMPLSVPNPALLHSHDALLALTAPEHE